MHANGELSADDTIAALIVRGKDVQVGHGQFSYKMKYGRGKPF